MEKLFEPILDEDEQILKIYKPNKIRALFSTVLGWLFVSVWLVLTFVVTLIDKDAGKLAWLWPVIGFIIFTVLIFLFFSLWYSKTIYAVTNKRVLIRTGYIGVDYKGLNYDMLGALTVNVNWLDKLIHKNTGTISFGSMSSPLTNQSGAKFTFSYIYDPYVVYKEVKSIIDAHTAK